MVQATNGIKETFLFTSESVGEGHPDKIAWGTLENSQTDCTDYVFVLQ